MENKYFKPNPALQVASNDQDRLVGQQQAAIDMEAMEAVRMTEELREADMLAANREGVQGLGNMQSANVAPTPQPAGLGVI